MYRILICDDSAFMRRALQDILGSDPMIDIVAVARNGREAIELVKEHTPDAITLDIEMPEIDGLTALRTIMRETPTRVLMLSSLTTKGSDAAMKAMRFGAADVMAKDHATVPSNLQEIESDLVKRVKALAASPVTPKEPHASARHSSASSSSAPSTDGSSRTIERTLETNRFDAILIGSSTGGPPVLETVIQSLSPDLQIPVVIAQHMPKLFTESMARRLDETCPLPVVHLDDRLPIRSGVVHIAPGGSNTHISPCRTGAPAMARVNQEPESTVYFPSVDVLFQSGTQAFSGPILSVVLTGMGDDGAKGAVTVKSKGGVVLTQSGETCVVNGMPKATVNAGASDASCAPARIGTLLGTIGATASTRGAA